MLVRFWGTRGSIATPGSATNRYGGNTSCVEIVTDSGKRFVCDCGTGARPLGAFLMAQKQQPVEATILLSHTHWDHIQGFPFFAPLFVPGNRITVCGPHGAHATLREVLAGQMEYTYFPVELAQLGAQIQYIDLAEGVHELEGVRVTAQFLNHPAVALGYRIEADGSSVLYVCDHEPYWEPLWRSDVYDQRLAPGTLEAILHDGDHRHAAFMQNADVVIHDSQYTPEEYPGKKNWGHSTYSYVTQIAAAANVKKLFLTHHDPAHSDEFLDGMELRAKQMAAGIHSPMLISCAREGVEERVVRSSGNSLKMNQVASSEQDIGESLLVLVIDDDEDLRVVARRALLKAGHRVIEAATGEEGIAIACNQQPDLILLDLLMPGMDGLAVLERLQIQQKTSAIPVIVLTAHEDEESARKSFDSGATDFLSKPFTPPQLDTRVRSCFARAR